MLPALLSKLSSESEQGQVQGAFGATCSLAFAIGPVSWGAFCAWHLRSKPAHVPARASRPLCCCCADDWLTEQALHPSGFVKHLPWHVGPRDAFLVGAILALLATMVGCTIPSRGVWKAGEGSGEERRPLLEGMKTDRREYTQRLADRSSPSRGSHVNIGH